MARDRLPVGYLSAGASGAWDPKAIADAYRGRFNWGEGRRLPDESKAVQLVCEQALIGAGIRPSRHLGADFGIVLAGCFGGFASYERFRDGLAPGADLQPMAFSFALPGVPASVVSLYYGITGPVVSQSTAPAAGGPAALETALGLLHEGLCERVIAGCWYFPSRTARRCSAQEHVLAAAVVLCARPTEVRDVPLWLQAGGEEGLAPDAEDPERDPLFCFVKPVVEGEAGGTRTMPLAAGTLTAVMDVG